MKLFILLNALLLAMTSSISAVSWISVKIVNFRLCIILITFVLIFFFIQLQQQYDFDSHFTIQLHHALDPENPDSFTSRGNISILSVNTGEFQTSQKELTQKDRQGLAEIAKNDGFYRLKADVVGSDGVKTTFLTSSKAVSWL